MTTRLLDVRVDTLGLVDKGANGEEFFLMKSDGGQGLLDKVVAAVKGAFKSDQKEDVVDENTVVKTEETTEQVVAEVAEVETVVETAEVEKTDVVEKNDLGEITELIKSMRGEIDALRAQLGEAQQTVEKTQEVVVEKEFIEKAAQFDGLPVKKEELAKHLYAISKAAPESVAYLEEVFKAMNNVAKDAGLFSEKGTTQIPEIKGVVEKAQELSKDNPDAVRENLLALPADVQQKYLDELSARRNKK